MSTCAARLRDERAAQRHRSRDRARSAAAQRVQPQIGRDLIVAAARGVQAAAGVADLVDQPRLDVHVHVLERVVPRQLAARELAPRRGADPSRDRRRVGGGDDALRGEHLGVRDRAGDVVREQPMIEADRGVERRRGGIERAFEATATCAFRFGHGAQYRRVVPMISVARSRFSVETEGARAGCPR